MRGGRRHVVHDTLYTADNNLQNIRINYFLHASAAAFVIAKNTKTVDDDLDGGSETAGEIGICVERRGAATQVAFT